MEATFPAFALVVAVVIMGYALWLQPRRRARRVLGRLANTPIAEIKNGEWAKITGVVSVRAPLLTSPIAERECIGFRLDVERVDGTHSTVFERQACGAFTIADDTGQVHVDGPFLLGLDAQGDWSTMRPRLLALLDAAGVPTLQLASYRGFAFREALLQPGDRVSVLGLAFREPDPAAPAAGFRSPPLVLRMRGSVTRPIIVADVGDDVTR
jgi:hypothetical protein